MHMLSTMQEFKLIFTAAWLSFCIFYAWFSQWRFAYVERVIDGDTVKVFVFGGVEAINSHGYIDLTEHISVRFLGINADELDERYGPEAKRALAEYIEKEYVWLKRDRFDRHGRLTGDLEYSGKSVSEWLVKFGHAHTVKQYLKDKRLLIVEKWAKAERLGRWAKRWGKNEATR